MIDIEWDKGSRRWCAFQPGPGSPPCGYGKTPLEALGAFFWHHTPEARYSENALRTIRKKHPDHCWETAR